MRILAAADLHGVLRVYEWLAELAATEADLLILAGDLFDADWEEGQKRQAANIVRLLKTVPIPTLYLMGNDDNVPLGYEDERIRLLHGRRVELDKYNFVGYHFTPPFVGDVFVKPEEEIALDLHGLDPLLDERTVFVTHAPAFGKVDRTYGGDNAGSRPLDEVIRGKPVLAHIHGHIHESFGRDGRHFNVASAGRCRAMVIELPSLHHIVLRLEGGRLHRE